jgi:hypothetical protein
VPHVRGSEQLRLARVVELAAERTQGMRDGLHHHGVLLPILVRSDQPLGGSTIVLRIPEPWRRTRERIGMDLPPPLLHQQLGGGTH